MKIVVDGYNAPVTAGAFVDLVEKKFYDNMEIQRADGMVVQTGRPEGPVGFKLSYLLCRIICCDYHSGCCCCFLLYCCDSSCQRQCSNIAGHAAVTSHAS